MCGKYMHMTYARCGELHAHTCMCACTCARCDCVYTCSNNKSQTHACLLAQVYACMLARAAHASTHASMQAFRRSLGISESAISFCTSRLFVQRNAAPFCGALGKDGLNSFPWEFYFDTVRLQMGICHILSQLVMFLSLCRLGESCL